MNKRKRKKTLQKAKKDVKYNKKGEDIKKKILKCILKGFWELFLVALIPIITIIYNKYDNNKKMINNIVCLTIGQSYDYVNGCFGPPFFEKEHSEYGISEEVYKTERAIIRAFFKDKKMIAYFVTLDKEDKTMAMPERIARFCDGNKMGELTFNDVDGGPLKICSYVSNGVGHMFYCEKYYFGSPGYYFDFYFMYLDYGFDKMNYDEQAFLEDKELTGTDKEEACEELSLDRSSSKPNTYGIIAEEQEVIELLIMKYSDFDFWSMINE